MYHVPTLIEHEDGSRTIILGGPEATAADWAAKAARDEAKARREAWAKRFAEAEPFEW